MNGTEPLAADANSCIPTFGRMQNYRQLAVWKKAHAIALNIHRLTKEIPREGNAELINQLRRSSLSIPANIAEGTSRPTDKDFANAAWSDQAHPRHQTVLMRLPVSSS